MSVSAEQRLFVGVIAAAVMDATGSVRGGDSQTTADRTKRTARAWFMEAGSDFQTVCTLADFNPMILRDRVLAYLARVDADPEQIIRMPQSGTSPRLSDRPQEITMIDVGRSAGVSVATVARVLDGQGFVATETRTRVLAAIEALGYRPSRRRNAHVH